ncbi:MAG: bifunctional UDP-N-acetylglucosamine diphosphorylase/glucosamine-1-phosphate N-acetyltransferase GlmU [Flavobacteriaceae bacterium]
MSDTLFIVLAAGEGTRMRSSRPKVMHKIAGMPMLGHALHAARAAFPGARFCVVVGPGMDTVADYAREHADGCAVAVQSERLGTAHAVLQARASIEAGDWRRIIVLYGDTPLIRPESLSALAGSIDGGASVAVLGFRPEDPHGYGRLVIEAGRLVRIVEEKDASPEERAIGFCNSGVVGFDGRIALQLLDAIGNDNAKGEYYLTDAVAGAVAAGLRASAVEAEANEVLGVNTRGELARAEALAQTRYRAAAMAAGVTLIDPSSVYFSHDTVIGRDVVIEPNVFFGEGVTVGAGTTIHGFSHIAGADIGEDADIGPFARLRPGAKIGKEARIGNFVEVKNAVFEAGAKANHLSYIGDAHVGEKANIGAGTITCNYDGRNKHKTDIGAGAFIGSNSALVAPVRIGKGAYVGSGSVITEDVSDGALAIGRGRQVEKPGRAPKPKI